MEHCDQLYLPLDFPDQQEKPPITGTPNYRLHKILTNQPKTDTVDGIINLFYQYQLEIGVAQSRNTKNLILGVRGSSLPPTPLDPSPPLPGGESSDE
jgi:hypothetical protein